MDNRLKDKVCVVTGGSGVLCSSMAEALLKEGAKVVLLGRSLEKLEKTARGFAEKGLTQTLCISADVCSKEAIVKAHEKIKEEWGKVDILVNGAGGNNPNATTSLEEITDKDDLKAGFFGIDIDAFKSIFDLNFIGTLIPSLVFGEDMVASKEGSIINISSMAAQAPLTKVCGYSASKAAIDNYTRWLSVHFAKMNVRVNAIAPGFFVSQQNKFLLYKEGTEELTPRGQKIINNTPMDRFGTPEDLEAAVIYLAGSGSRFVTGTIMAIDGGFSAYSGV